MTRLLASLEREATAAPGQDHAGFRDALEPDAIGCHLAFVQPRGVQQHIAVRGIRIVDVQAEMQLRQVCTARIEVVQRWQAQVGSGLGRRRCTRRQRGREVGRIGAGTRFGWRGASKRE